ncbi:MAG: helix-turn-helix domain-containing protein [Firmicutes bacterium]|nr:helix-turn-helix domain-containing protein [Bacillota bacterium]
MFGNRLKELRVEKNLSQAQLAAAIGFSQSNLAKWERAVHDPPTDALIALAKFFDVSVDYLLGLEDEFGNILREK